MRRAEAVQQMSEDRPEAAGALLVERHELHALFEALERRGYQLVGPVVHDGAIVYDRLSGVEDLPAGWTDEQGEAPRGILWQRYQIGADGLVRTARIVPPTAQNQAVIEDDLRAVVQQALALPDAELTLCSEQAIRNHRPCIWCATHVLDLTIDRG
jgi:Ni,Fe-hydrogenase III large subunit